MIATMTPVLLHGRVVWDQALFPRDECEERLGLVQAAMAERGLGGLLVAGAKVDFGNLVYLTQFVPYAAWAVVVVPLQGEPTLVTGTGGGRELPVSRPRTWLADVRNLRNLESALAELVEERGIRAPLGVVSLDSLGPALAARAREALQAYTPVDAHELLAALRGGLRSRELSAVRSAATIVQQAATALTDAHAAGASNVESLIAAEARARQLGALDFRGLINQADDGELAPFEGPSDYRSEPAVAYLAASSLGYWADLAVTAGRAAPGPQAVADSALAAMLAAIRPGAPASSIAAAAAAILSADQLRDAAALGLGSGLGLTLNGPPAITRHSSEPVVGGSVLSLRLRVRDHAGVGVFASRLVRVTDTSAEPLVPSTPNLAGRSAPACP